eukprot:2697205-Ditylum_brightwellii.AAC.1
MAWYAQFTSDGKNTNRMQPAKSKQIFRWIKCQEKCLEVCKTRCEQQRRGQGNNNPKRAARRSSGNNKPVRKKFCNHCQMSKYTDVECNHHYHPKNDTRSDRNNCNRGRDRTYNHNCKCPHESSCDSHCDRN